MKNSIHSYNCLSSVWLQRWCYGQFSVSSSPVHVMRTVGVNWTQMKPTQTPGDHASTGRVLVPVLKSFCAFLMHERENRFNLLAEKCWHCLWRLIEKYNNIALLSKCIKLYTRVRHKLLIHSRTFSFNLFPAKTEDCTAVYMTTADVLWKAKCKCCMRVLLAPAGLKLGIFLLWGDRVTYRAS